MFLQVKWKRKSGSLLPGFPLSESEGYYVVGELENPLAKLIKREEYPGTYAYTQSDGSIVLGYGPNNPLASDEFLRIIIDCKGFITITRDVYATLPLFYGISVDSECFVLSNNYNYVVENLPCKTLNQVALLNVLIPNADGHSTLWNEIHILEERQVLELGHTLTIHQPEGRSWTSSRDAEQSDPKRFRAVFASHLDAFIEKFLAKKGFAFEVSGGLDSSTLPLYVGKNYASLRTLFGSIIFPGQFGQTQMEKLDSLETTGLRPTTVHIDPQTDYPLARMINNSMFFEHYCFDEIYTEAMRKLAIILYQQDVRIIATGTGGDELFEITDSIEQQLQYGKTEFERREKMAYQPYLTSNARKMYISSTPTVAPFPLSLLSVSLYGSHIARNNIYIEQGIWPVTPYADVQLYRYCQGLPEHLRVNKNILRAFCSVYRFSQDIYKPKQNEHFGMFLVDSFSSGKYDHLLKLLIKHSITHEYGLVDTDVLILTFQKVKTMPDMIKRELFFYNVLEWMKAEINLQVSLSLL